MSLDDVAPPTQTTLFLHGSTQKKQTLSRTDFLAFHDEPNPSTKHAAQDGVKDSVHHGMLENQFATASAFSVSNHAETRLSGAVAPHRPMT
jgi:hypothetical protein